MEKLLSDLRHQGWKIRPEYIGNLVTYEAKFMNVKIHFADNGEWSHTLNKSNSDIEKAAVDFAVQQIRRIK